MLRRVLLALALVIAAPLAFAAKTAAQLALAIDTPDAAALADDLRAGLAAPEPLLRATAARVAAVRAIDAVLPVLRTQLSQEHDLDAAREEVRALVLLGEPADVDLAVSATRGLPSGIDDVIARAVARRRDALDLYIAKLRANGFVPDAEFFMQALWQRGTLAIAAGARLLGGGDVRGWRALLSAMRRANLAMDANVLSAAIGSSSEEMRVETIWYLIHGYAFDPRVIPQRVRDALATDPGEVSLREGFGRELLRRMLGGEPKEDPRWLDWLQTEEADALIRSESALFEYFTDKEFIARKTHCQAASVECRIPDVRGTKIPSIPVAPPAFQLPDVLPAGLADAVVAETRCEGRWIATATASADTAGRVRDVTVNRLTLSSACERALTTLMKLSLATPESLAAPARTGIVLVHQGRDTVCLDEGLLGAASSVVRNVGGDVKAPIVKKKIEPQFPDDARKKMGRSRYVTVILQSVIAKNGCVRSMRMLEQSPFPDLNTAALVALSQWRFEPGRLNGEPVDVSFNLSVRFSIP